jgi:hypothetical protein
MSIRVCWQATLIACSAICVFAQDPLREPEPEASTVNLNQPSDTTSLQASVNVVAYCGDVCGFIASTGNLYFTSAYNNEFDPDTASFYRTSKSGTPGSERLLYQESGDRPGNYFFGRPVWAYTNGTYYGYFAANYSDFGVYTSQIKRIPLAGGSAVTLAYAPDYIGGQDLVTDGSRLFWADRRGIRSMPIEGGAIQTLVPVSGSARVLIGLDATHLYYTLGTSLYRILKAGGPSTALATASKTITAIWVDTRYGTTGLWAVFWGEKDGAVRRIGTSGYLTTYRDSYPGRDITSVGYTGIGLLWIECTQPGNSYCNIRKNYGTPVADGGVGARNLQWDSTSFYWVGSGSIRRSVY